MSLLANASDDIRYYIDNLKVNEYSAVLLCGSRARGDDNESSDYDFCLVNINMNGIYRYAENNNFAKLEIGPSIKGLDIKCFVETEKNNGCLKVKTGKEMHLTLDAIVYRSGNSYKHEELLSLIREDKKLMGIGLTYNQFLGDKRERRRALVALIRALYDHYKSKNTDSSDWKIKNSDRINALKEWIPDEKYVLDLLSKVPIRESVDSDETRVYIFIGYLWSLCRGIEGIRKNMESGGG